MQFQDANLAKAFVKIVEDEEFERVSQIDEEESQTRHHWHRVGDELRRVWAHIVVEHYPQAAYDCVYAID